MKSVFLHDFIAVLHDALNLKGNIYKMMDMDLPDQQFIYALSFQNGAHLETYIQLSCCISGKGH